jgi:hypothetical protein
VLFVGGTGDDGSSNSAYLFDPATESFSPAGSMSVARLAQSALQGDGTVLIAGGQVCPGNGTCPALQSAEIYDPATGTFSMTGNMMIALASLPDPSGAIVVGDAVVEWSIRSQAHRASIIL